MPNYKRNLYRYILNGIVDPETSISQYHLIAQNHFPEDQNHPITEAVRIPIPTNLKLKHKRGNLYNTTDDKRSLADLHAALVVKINGRWKENPFGWTLKTMQPAHVMQAMLRNQYYYTILGYMDKDRYRFFINHYSQNPENQMETQAFEKQYQNFDRKTGTCERKQKENV